MRGASKEKTRTGMERRGFLTTAGLSGLGAAAGVAVGLPPSEAEAYETPEEQVKARYKETPHVLRYYFLNRL